MAALLHPRVLGLAASGAEDARRLLATQADVPWTQSRLAEALHDRPALSLELVCAAWQAPAPDFRTALAGALAAIGEDLVCAWLHHLAQQPPLRSDAFVRLNRHARRSAALAAALAQESGLCAPADAWCAGLWHNLGQCEFVVRHPGYPGPAEDRRESQLAAGELQQYGEDHGSLLARQLDQLITTPYLAEAVELQHAAPDFVARMPGLPRVLRAAVALLAGPVENLPLAQSLLKLPAVSIQPHLDLPIDTLGNGAAGHAALPEPAWRSLLAAGFAEVEGARLMRRLHAACRLFGGRPLHALLRWRDGALLPHPLWGEDIPTLPAQDESSACLRSLHGGRVVGSHSEGPNAADWLLARRLGLSAFECVPWRCGDESGVAILAIDTRRGEQAGAAGPQLASCLQAAMAAQLRAHAARETLELAVSQAREQEISAARRVAHEISNPLSTLGNYLAVLENQNGGSEQTRAMLRQMQGEIARTQRLLATLGRPGAAAAERRANPNEALLEIAALHRDSLLRHNVTLHLALAEALPPVAMSPDALRQVLINLVLNAAEAIGRDGSIHLASGADYNLDGIAWVALSVGDDGPGLPRQGLALELPGASSKGGHHSGSGLPICKSLIGEAGGHLLCQSRPGGGARFTILLQAVQSSQEGK